MSQAREVLVAPVPVTPPPTELETPDAAKEESSVDISNTTDALQIMPFHGEEEESDSVVTGVDRLEWHSNQMCEVMLRSVDQQEQEIEAQE